MELGHCVARVPCKIFTGGVYIDFVHKDDSVGRMWLCRRRKGPYLPTVPELTHMPLCWWFSRSLKPDKETDEVAALVPLFVQNSHKAKGRRRTSRTALLCHILPLIRLCRPPLLILLLAVLDAADTMWRHLDWKQSPDERKSRHNCHELTPRLSHPLFLLLCPQLISPETRLKTLRHDTVRLAPHVLRSLPLRKREL